MKVTTKKGDTGKTTLFNKADVPKYDDTIVLLGEIDETQSLLGLMKQQLPDQLFITSLQRNLYSLMGEVSGARKVSRTQIQGWLRELEKEQEKLLARTPIGSQFVIPGKSPRDAWCQYARTVVRRLERTITLYAKDNSEMADFLPYINRMSDYLFILGQA